MIDIWIGDGLLILALPLYLWSALMRIRPRMNPDGGFVSTEALQVEYRRRYLMRLLLLRIVPTVLTVYFGVRIIQWPPDLVADGLGVDTLLLLLAAVVLASMIVTSVVRIFQEQSFLKQHPEFGDSFLPIKGRVLVQLPYLLGLVSVVAGFSQGDPSVKLALIALGVCGVFIGGSIRFRMSSLSRFELPWDGPVGKQIAAVVEQFGCTPKKLILLPSLLPNAYAMPDGSVMVTSALQTIATPEEVSAVVAHELSHVRDKEGKKLNRLRTISLVPIAILIFLTVVWGQRQPFEALVVPFAGFGGITLSMATTWWYCRRSQPIEFKCDADAAKIGMAKELASCLDKITRFNGTASRWIGIDRFLITHPSLEDRVARLRS